MMKARILALRSRTEPNAPRWMACLSFREGQTSSRFIHEAWVAVLFTWTLAVPGFAGHGDLADRDLPRGEERGGFVVDVVMGAALGQSGL